MKKYIVTSRLIHDGGAIEPGAAIEIEDVLAAPLLRAGAIKEDLRPETVDRRLETGDQRPEAADRRLEEEILPQASSVPATSPAAMKDETHPPAGGKPKNHGAKK